MTARSRWLILAFAILGLGFATYSTWVHYKLMTDVTYVASCDLNSSFNCSQVYLSRYGSVGGKPVAIAGMFWFGLVALIAAFARQDKSSAAGAYVFLMSTIGLAVILYLGWASVTQLKTYCILCIGTYVSVIAIFIVSGSASSVPLSQIPKRLFDDLFGALRKPAVSIFALMLLAGTVGLAAYFPEEGTRPNPAAAVPTGKATTDFASAWAAQPRVNLGIPADGASVVIVKFNDWQCPACKDTHLWYKPVLEKFAKSHPGAIKYVLKDWPWDTKCNFNSGQTLHPGACAAAVAVRIAREKGTQKEEEMVNWIFTNIIPPAAPEAVKASAEKILGISDFDRQYAARVKDVQRDIADGGALSIGSTPTLFINGVRVDRQLMPPQYLEMAIDLELKKAGK